VGDIPQGLPKFSVPKAFEYAESLIPTALLITGVAILVQSPFVSYLSINRIIVSWLLYSPITLIFKLQESVGIAKALAAKNGYELDSNQEVYFFPKYIYCSNILVDMSGNLPPPLGKKKLPNVYARILRAN